MNFVTGDIVSVNGILFKDKQPRTFKVNMLLVNDVPSYILLKTPDERFLENTSHSDFYYVLMNKPIPLPNRRPERINAMVIPTGEADKYLEKLSGGRRRHRKTRRARRTRRRPSRRN
jgi:hypothetical protein